MVTLLKETTEQLVTPFAMMPGQYGIIVKWGGDNKPSCHVGAIVFRTRDDLRDADPFRAFKDHRWTADDVNKRHGWGNSPDYQIRILPPGTELRLVVEDPNG